jgi:hypothetical protein
MRFVVELLTSALRFVAGEETGSVYGTAGKKVLAEVVPSENLTLDGERRQYITVSRACNYFFRPRAVGPRGLCPPPNLFIVARRAR